ncbi:unnamed protein product, partial [Heterosigma akashiwo]
HAGGREQEHGAPQRHLRDHPGGGVHGRGRPAPQGPHAQVRCPRHSGRAGDEPAVHVPAQPATGRRRPEREDCRRGTARRGQPGGAAAPAGSTALADALKGCRTNGAQQVATGSSCCQCTGHADDGDEEDARKLLSSLLLYFCVILLVAILFSR